MTPHKDNIGTPKNNHVFITEFAKFSGFNFSKEAPAAINIKGQVPFVLHVNDTYWLFWGLITYSLRLRYMPEYDRKMRFGYQIFVLKKISDKRNKSYHIIKEIALLKLHMHYGLGNEFEKKNAL